MKKLTEFERKVMSEFYEKFKAGIFQYGGAGDYTWIQDDVVKFIFNAMRQAAKEATKSLYLKVGTSVFIGDIETLQKCVKVYAEEAADDARIGALIRYKSHLLLHRHYVLEEMLPEMGMFVVDADAVRAYNDKGIAARGIEEKP